MKDKLGDRMKKYEMAYDHMLVRRLPLILRLDGKGFHKFTAGRFETPFDNNFKESMYHAATFVLENFSGAQVAYVQSDEMTLLFRNDLHLDMEPFYNNRIQKICSVAASLCAVSFYKKVSEFFEEELPVVGFDCRCFIMRPDEVVNNYIWRQRDAIRNAINSAMYWGIRKEGMKRNAATNFMNGMNSDQKIGYMNDELGIVMDDYPVHYKRGACITKVKKTMLVKDFMDEAVFKKLVSEGKMDEEQTKERGAWEVDYETPLFQEKRDYIERFLK